MNAGWAVVAVVVVAAAFVRSFVAAVVLAGWLAGWLVRRDTARVRNLSVGNCVNDGLTDCAVLLASLSVTVRQSRHVPPPHSLTHTTLSPPLLSLPPTQFACKGCEGSE